MKVTPTAIPGVLVIEPKEFSDERDFFFESFNQKTFNNATGLNLNFVQDSRSAKSVLSSLHYQFQQPQGKLVRVIRGEVFDVAVDISKSLPTFGTWEGIELTEEKHKQFWEPQGLTHGFLVPNDASYILYKTTDFYAQEYERCIRWNYPDLAIRWPLQGETPYFSAKDAAEKKLCKSGRL